jgi:hypothetical protein
LIDEAFDQPLPHRTGRSIVLMHDLQSKVAEFEAISSSQPSITAFQVC